jgi:hypothetical protein
MVVLKLVRCGNQCGVKVTRVGTGLNRPAVLHHGIRRKKLKYNSVQTWETSV